MKQEMLTEGKQINDSEFRGPVLQFAVKKWPMDSSDDPDAWFLKLKGLLLLLNRKQKELHAMDKEDEGLKGSLQQKF